MLGWLLKKGVKLGVIGLSVKELNDYRKEVSAEGKDPLSPGVFIKHFGGKVTDSIKSVLKICKKKIWVVWQLLVKKTWAYNIKWAADI